MNELHTTANYGDKLVIGRVRRARRHASRIGIALWLVACFLMPARAHAQSTLRLAAGFHASIYASGLTAPTAIALGPDGRLYVAEQAGQSVAIGHAGRVVIASGFATPLGVAFRPGTAELYATDNGRDNYGNSVPDELNRSAIRETRLWPSGVIA